MELTLDTELFETLEEAVAYEYVLRTSGLDLADRIKSESTSLANRMIQHGVWTVDELEENRSLNKKVTLAGWHEGKRVSSLYYLKIGLHGVNTPYWIKDSYGTL
jgi:hypothetical protein